MSRRWIVLLLFLSVFGAFGQIDSLKKMLAETPNDTNRVILLNNLAFNYYYINPDTSDYYINEALQLSEALNYKRGIALSNMRLGAGKSLRGDMVMAMNYLEKSLVMAYEIEDHDLIGRIFGSFGLTFSQMTDYVKAIQYFDRSIEHFTVVKNVEMVSTMYMNMGFCNTQLQQFDIAEKNYAEGLALMTPNHTYYGLMHHNMAVLELEKQHLTKADSLLAVAWRNLEHTEKTQQKGRVQSAMARYHLAMNDIDKAYYHCYQALPLFKDNGFKPGLRDTYQLLAKIEDLKGNHARAFHYLQLHIEYKDSIQNELSLQRIQLFEQLDRERLQTIRAQEQGLMIAERRNQRYLMYGAIIFFVIVVTSMSYTIINKQKVNSKLTKINSDIMAKNQELEQNKEDLMALNHKLKNREEDLLAINEELKQQQLALFRQRGELEKALDSLQLTQEQLLQSEKMASLGVLAAGIAHEINNPLNFIHGGLLYLDNYFKCKSKEEQDDIMPVLDGMSTGVTRAAAIVKSLSQYSRVDNAKFIECHIHTIIDDSLVMLNSEYITRIKIMRHYNASSDVVFGNEGKLHQAFLNIVDNAIQAIDGKGKIDITTVSQDGKMKVSIADTGSGIAPENLSKIFDPFFTTKDLGKGTGLGLSITYKIIQEHHGTITFDSKIGEGTTVILEFPLVVNIPLTAGVLNNTN